MANSVTSEVSRVQHLMSEMKELNSEIGNQLVNGATDSDLSTLQARRASLRDQAAEMLESLLAE